MTRYVCPYCTKGEVVIRHDGNDVSTDEYDGTIDVVRCNSCNMVLRVTEKKWKTISFNNDCSYIGVVFEYLGKDYLMDADKRRIALERGNAELRRRLKINEKELARLGRT